MFDDDQMIYLLNLSTQLSDVVSMMYWFKKKKKAPKASIYVQVLLCLFVLTLCSLSVNLSVSVVLQWRHARLSLMALCSTCGLTGQGSTAPEADSHKQKLCVYWHQATTSPSPAGGGGWNIME